MNEANLEYLKKSLDYLGFGSRLNEVLEAGIRREVPNFSVGISTYFEPPVRLGPDARQKDHVHFSLDFQKGKESDIYYLNDYTAELSTHNGLLRSQQFNLERDNRVTALQAYRLLLGAALQKEISQRGEGENAQAEKKEVWFKLNLDLTDSYGRHPLAKIHPSYGFDLTQVVDKYPLVWNKDRERAAVIEALQKGAFPKAAMEIDGKKELVILSANPRMKNLDVYDQQMNVIRNDRILSEGTLKDMVQKVELSGQGESPRQKEDGLFQEQEHVDQSRSRGR